MVNIPASRWTVLRVVAREYRNGAFGLEDRQMNAVGGLMAMLSEYCFQIGGGEAAAP
jgi:hypothetical protein